MRAFPQIAALAFTLLFVGLKLAHVIDLSWWLVLAPAWGLPVLVFAIDMMKLYEEFESAARRKGLR